RADLGDVVHRVERLLALAVAHAEAAADVDAGEPVARRLELAPERGQPLQRLPDRGHVQQLRADVHVQAVEAYVRPGRLRLEPGPRLGDRDAELVLGLAGGNLGVGQRVHVRVDAYRGTRGGAAFRGDRLQQFELVAGFDVEAGHACVQPLHDFPCALADAGKHD